MIGMVLKSNPAVGADTAAVPGDGAGFSPRDRVAKSVAAAGAELFARFGLRS